MLCLECLFIRHLCIYVLQVKMWYDKVGHQLIVNILQAIDLPPRSDGRPRNPYVKMYFLPDRRYVSFFFWSLLICASSFNVLVIMFYVHICFTLVIRAREGRRQWRKVWSPSGTRHLCTLMSIAGISENTCWRLLCGTNPKYKMRRVTFWEKYEAYVIFVLLFTTWIALWKHSYTVTPDYLSWNLDPNRAGDCPVGW